MGNEQQSNLSYEEKHMLLLEKELSAMSFQDDVRAKLNKMHKSINGISTAIQVLAFMLLAILFKVWG